MYGTLGQQQAAMAEYRSLVERKRAEREGERVDWSLKVLAALAQPVFWIEALVCKIIG